MFHYYISVSLCAYCFLFEIKFYVSLFYCCTECDDMRSYEGNHSGNEAHDAHTRKNVCIEISLTRHEQGSMLYDNKNVEKASSIFMDLDATSSAP